MTFLKQNKSRISFFVEFSPFVVLDPRLVFANPLFWFYTDFRAENPAHTTVFIFKTMMKSICLQRKTESSKMVSSNPSDVSYFSSTFLCFSQFRIRQFSLVHLAECCFNKLANCQHTEQNRRLQILECKSNRAIFLQAMISHLSFSPQC
jgi:hypothetical protein